MTDFVKQNDIDKKAEELREASEMSENEFGKWWRRLADLVPTYRDGASDAFAEAIELEIIAEHKKMKEEFTYSEADCWLVHNSELGV